MEEIRNEEVTTMETTEHYPVNNVEPEEGGSNIVVPIMIGGLLVAAAASAAGIIWKKRKSKRKDKMIDELVKEGYTIVPPEKEYEDIVDSEIVEEDEKPKKK